MTNEVAVRPVGQADFAGRLELWDGYNAFYGRAGTMALPMEITRVTWSRFFDGYEPMHALVAERVGELLGLAHYLFTAAPRCSDQSVTCKTYLPRKQRAAKASDGR